MITKLITALALVASMTLSAHAGEVKVDDLFVDGGQVFARVGANNHRMMTDTLCGSTAEKEAKTSVPGGVVTVTKVSDTKVKVGDRTIEWSCWMAEPLSKLGAYVRKHWADRRHGDQAFRADHLGCMLESIQGGKMTIIGPERLQGWAGHYDRDDIQRLMKQGGGTFLAYTCTKESIQYFMVPQNECGLVCVVDGEEGKLLHQHKAVPRAAPRTVARPPPITCPPGQSVTEIVGLLGCFATIATPPPPPPLTGTVSCPQGEYVRLVNYHRDARGLDGVEESIAREANLPLEALGRPDPQGIAMVHGDQLWAWGRTAPDPVPVRVMVYGTSGASLMDKVFSVHGKDDIIILPQGWTSVRHIYPKDAVATPNASKGGVAERRLYPVEFNKPGGGRYCGLRVPSIAR